MSSAYFKPFRGGIYLSAHGVDFGSWFVDTGLAVQCNLFVIRPDAVYNVWNLFQWQDWDPTAKADIGNKGDWTVNKWIPAFNAQLARWFAPLPAETNTPPATIDDMNATLAEYISDAGVYPPQVKVDYNKPAPQPNQ